ncbi:LysE family translocator [Labrenzia sp. VG12]|uniref:LysE family translocator n=1 Tax=Labrenzia sp. VG12 TaxID=2021862 RepID=UPI000B8BBA15|nr:LysE family translocator [Labrenzia sp. VG12]ASP36403.1 lysine transporter LysE [Labrenzia sp. VG12]
MSLETYLAFMAAALILTMSPGPSILLGMVHALHFGSKRTLFTALGDITANLIQMLLVAIGLGVLIANSLFAFQLLKWGGVIVLICMSLRMLRAAPASAGPGTPDVPSSRPARLFLSGFLVAFGNPKALVFFTAFFPQFIDPTADLGPQLLLMCPTMAALDFAFVMLYAAGARAAFGFLRAHPGLLNKVGGTALMGAAGFLAFAR